MSIWPYEERISVMVPLNSLAAGHENVGYVEIDGKYHPLRIFHAVAGVPEDRHTCIITWPSDDAKSHDATARLKEFLVAGDIKRDFDHNHTPRTPSTRPSAARASQAAARRTRSSTESSPPCSSLRDELPREIENPLYRYLTAISRLRLGILTERGEGS